MRVLIIRFSSIGDIVLTTPLVAAITERHPEAVIDYLTLADYRVLLEHNPHINQLIAIPRRASLAENVAGARAISRNGYDLVVDLHRSTRSAVYRRFVRAREKRTLDKRYVKRALLVSAKMNLYREPLSIVHRYFHVARALGVTPTGAPAEIWDRYESLIASARVLEALLGFRFAIAAMDRAAVTPIRREIVATGAPGPVISLMPSRPGAPRKWGDDRFVELGRRLVSERGAIVLVHGGPGDTARAEPIVRAIGPGAVMLAGATTLMQSALALAASDCLVTNDTGLMHIGGAVRIPVIAIFGSTVEELGFFPYETAGTVMQVDLSCRPCTTKGLRACPKRHFRCMNDINVDSVVDAIGRFPARR